jgi:hypothetical protein
MKTHSSYIDASANSVLLRKIFDVIVFDNSNFQALSTFAPHMNHRADFL